MFVSFGCLTRIEALTSIVDLNRRLSRAMIIVALGGLILVVAAVIFWRAELKTGIEWSVGTLREAGPLAFFAGMAVLPAIGFPLAPFVVAAGPVFGPALGRTGVVACSIGAVALNVTLTYGLTTTALRRWVGQWVQRLGYRFPQSSTGSAWQIVVLVRLAPGLPFWVQSYVLGLLKVRFVPYVTMSVAIPACFVVGTVLGGDALVRGEGKIALLALAIIGFGAAGIQLWRKRVRTAPVHPARNS